MVSSAEQDAEQLWQIISDVRDASPRLYNDADTDLIVESIIAEWAPVAREEAKDALIVELLARRDATDMLLGDFIGHPRYPRMTYPQAAERATAFNIYEDALDVGYGRDIEQQILTFAEEHDEAVTARSRELFDAARAKNPEYQNDKRGNN